MCFDGVIAQLAQENFSLFMLSKFACYYQMLVYWIMLKAIMFIDNSHNNVHITKYVLFNCYKSLF